MQIKSDNSNVKVNKSKVEEALFKNVCTNDQSSLTNEKFEFNAENNISVSALLTEKNLSSKTTHSNNISDIGFKAVNSDLEKSLDSNSFNGSAKIVQSVNPVKNYEYVQNSVSKSVEQWSQSTENGFNKMILENVQLFVGEQQRCADVDNDVMNGSKMNVTINCFDKSEKDRVEGSPADVTYLEKCSNNVTVQDLKHLQHSQDITFGEHLQSLRQSSLVPEMQYQTSSSSYLQYFNASPQTQNLIKQNMQCSSVPIRPCPTFHIQSQNVITADTGCQKVYVQDKMQYENLHPSGAQCFNPKKDNLQNLVGEMDNVEKYTMETNVSVQNMKHLNLSPRRMQNQNLLFQNIHPDPFFKNSQLPNMLSQNVGNISCSQHSGVLLQNTGRQRLQFSNVHHPNMPVQNVQYPNQLVLRNIQHPYVAVTTNINVQPVDADQANLQVDHFINQKESYPNTFSNYAISSSPQSQHFLQGQQSLFPHSFYHSDINSYQNSINFDQGLPSNFYVQGLSPVTNLNHKKSNIETENNARIPEYKEGQYFNYLKDVEENYMLQNLHNVVNTQSNKTNVQVESTVDNKIIILNNVEGSLPSFRTNKEQNLIAKTSFNVSTIQSPYRMQDMTNLLNLGSEIQDFTTSNVQSTACNTNKNLFVQDDYGMNQNWKNCKQGKQTYSSVRQDQVNDSRVTNTTANFNMRQINTGLENFNIQEYDSMQSTNFVRESKTSNDTNGHFNVRIGITDKSDADEEQRQCNIPPLVSPLSCMNFGINSMKQVGSVYNSPTVFNSQFNSTENVNPNFGQGINSYGFFAQSGIQDSYSGFKKTQNREKILFNSNANTGIGRGKHLSKKL